MLLILSLVHLESKHTLRATGFHLTARFGSTFPFLASKCSQNTQVAGREKKHDRRFLFHWVLMLFFLISPASLFVSSLRNRAPGDHFLPSACCILKNETWFMSPAIIQSSPGSKFMDTLWLLLNGLTECLQKTGRDWFRDGDPHVSQLPAISSQTKMSAGCEENRWMIQQVVTEAQFQNSRTIKGLNSLQSKATNLLLRKWAENQPMIRWGGWGSLSLLLSLFFSLLPSQREAGILCLWRNWISLTDQNATPHAIDSIVHPCVLDGLRACVTRRKQFAPSSPVSAGNKRKKKVGSHFEHRTKKYLNPGDLRDQKKKKYSRRRAGEAGGTFEWALDIRFFCVSGVCVHQPSTD